MPVRYQIDPEESLDRMLQKVNQLLLKGLSHQRYPYNILINDLKLLKTGFDSLFDTVINYYNTSFNVDSDDYPFDTHEFFNGNQLYSLQIIIRDWL